MIKAGGCAYSGSNFASNGRTISRISRGRRNKGRSLLVLIASTAASKLWSGISNSSQPLPDFTASERDDYLENPTLIDAPVLSGITSLPSDQDRLQRRQRQDATGALLAKQILPLDQSTADPHFHLHLLGAIVDQVNDLTIAHLSGYRRSSSCPSVACRQYSRKPSLFLRSCGYLSSIQPGM